MVEDEGSSKMFTGRGRSHASCLHTHLHYYTSLKTQDLRKTKNSKAVFFCFIWLNNSWTHWLELVTRAFGIVTVGFKLVTEEFELVARGLKLVTRGFELVTCKVETVDLNC